MTTALERIPLRRMRNMSLWNSPLDRFFRNDLLDVLENDNLVTVPSINISEEKNNYVVSMAAPGLKKEDFDVRLEGNLLTISCEKESGSENNGQDGNNGQEGKDGKDGRDGKEGREQENYSRREYNYSYFSRSVSLPDTAENKNIVAKYTDGILTLMIPKKPDAEKNLSQKIKVQ
ncbi:MAG TPA: Hsp20/alpha crystallin family protein [Bacteroidia bacterium]|jgi:HSP20 family protein